MAELKIAGGNLAQVSEAGAHCRKQSYPSQSKRSSNFIMSGAVSAPLCVTVSVAYFNGKVSDCQTNNQIRFVRSGEIY